MATLAAQDYHVASCYAPQHLTQLLPNPVRSKVETLRKAFSAFFCYSFKVNTASSRDETAAIAASILFSLAAAMVSIQVACLLLA